MTSPPGGGRIVPAGDCQCSDGSEFSFWVREANPDKIVFYLQAGGGCFSAETCARESDLYQTTVKEGPSEEGGIFDFGDARNPFADYSVVYVPYCTGDVHLGDITTEYAPGLTVHHKGYVNGTAALDHLAGNLSRRDRCRRDGRERRLDRGAALCRARIGSAPRHQDHGAGGRIGFVPRRAPLNDISPPGASATPSRPGPRTPA